MTDWEKTARELGGMLQNCIDILDDCFEVMPNLKTNDMVMDYVSHLRFCASNVPPKPVLMRDMTETELNDHLTNQLLFVTRCQTPDTIGSMLIIFQDDGIVQYGSTIDPETAPAALRELADKIERRETVKRGDKPHDDDKMPSINPYTVLLLRPDYIADDFGADNYLAHVEAVDIADAVQAARRMAVNEDGTMIDNALDYQVLFACKGHVDDIKTND